MENLAVITALYRQVVFATICQILEKNTNIIHQPRSVRIEKNCDLCQGLGHSFPQYGPPFW